MIAANPSFSADSLDPNAPADWYHAKLPEISDETKKAITKARSWPMWVAIMYAFRQQQRKGRNAEVRAAAGDYQISIGIRRIARMIGLSASAARTQCRRLAELGLIHLSVDERPLKTLDAGEVAALIRSDATGKIVANRAGRAKPVIITLMVKNRHMRPQSAGKKAKQLVVGVGTTDSQIGSAQAPPDLSDRDRVETTSKEVSKEFNKEQPNGMTDGIGLPMAEDECTAPPPLPMGSRPKGPRITPKGNKGQGRKNGQEEERTPSIPWSAASDAAFAATKARLARDLADRPSVIVRHDVSCLEQMRQMRQAMTANSEVCTA